MTSNELRARFLDFFRQQGHTVVPSSPLVPGNDPTLLFTNAGMVQFKDVFTGQDKRPYTRATSSQRCVRAGGKHNDLENVGYTARHHTFFEMLGNFSFGDYFKQDAIRFAWDFITSKDWLGIDPSRLLVTVYETDDEAYNIWHTLIGIPADRIVRIGDNKGAPYASDNFWAMGDTGPCGPCTEIFYDHDPDGSKGIWGGPPGSPEEDGDRWIEIWNVVFMQFERAKDGTLTELPAPSVDTGMGLERIAALMQGTNDNYQIDIFKTLVGAVAKLAGAEPYASPSQKVIADHIRPTAFLIIDGVLPSNEGRGYVLRRIMRRAIRHGYKLGLNEAFFYKLVAPLAEAMGEAYPELREQQARIEKAIRQEEDNFASTLDKGMKLLDEAIGRIKNDVIPGEVVFKLYDTYGFPFDLTADIARERNLKLDEAGYQREMDAQRERARAASKFTAGEGLKYDGKPTEFIEESLGLSVDGVKVVALYRGNEAVDALNEGDEGAVVLDRTPFYAESGGQVGDRGVLLPSVSKDAGEDVSDEARTQPESPSSQPFSRGEKGFRVVDTQKIKGGAFAHAGKLEAGVLKVGDVVTATVESSQRRATMRNHSATHLMHKALRDVLGEHVQQKGSLVDAGKTRFDFAHGQPMTTAELADVEQRVNAEVLENLATQIRVLPIEEAKLTGAMMLFGEKYGETVRVLDIGSSRELCGGTHVARTGDIGLFKIVSEGGVAAGVRRLEAVTGDNAIGFVNDLQGRLAQAAGLLKSSPNELANKITAVLDAQKALEKELATLKGKLAASAGDELAGKARDIGGGVKLLAEKVEGADGNGLRALLDQLKNKLGSSIVLLGSANGDKVNLIAGVSADLTARIKASELLAFAAAQVGGKGGGRPDMAQGGGTQPQNLPAALASAQDWVSAKLA